MKTRFLPVAGLALALPSLAILSGYTSGGSDQETKAVPTAADTPLAQAIPHQHSLKERDGGISQQAAPTRG